ncbi:MAG TPA: glycerol-3-phosphate 1-O-acyltransferase PlsY [Micropepsaceae bacterium]|nr:glycerol-3-phosphate 1-O-acyltransferase PlsY [Micropepsaceae bacterium]
MIETLALLSWATAWPYILATVVLSYLLGSIPFGVIFARLAGAGDIRKIGSGNIGATNVLRTGKRWAAAATLLCDGLKGFVAVIVAANMGGQIFAVFAGLGAFIGHLYPVWLGFKGGKGVATFIGIVLGLSPLMGLVVCAAWVGLAQTFRYSSLAALVSTALAPLGFFLFGRTLFAFLTFILVVLIFYSHRANIARLMRGEEPRIGAA